MKPPKHVDVGPHRYKVVIVPHGVLEGVGAGGSCQPRHNVIALDGEVPRSQLADTLLHELAHAMLATTDLDDAEEERVARILGPALLDLLRSNPHLVEWVTS